MYAHKVSRKDLLHTPVTHQPSPLLLSYSLFVARYPAVSPACVALCQSLGTAEEKLNLDESTL